MATSIDGFVARINDDTSWVSDTDWGIFSQMVKDAGCIVMGRRTYEVSADDFPYECDLNIVMTKSKKHHVKSNEKVLFTDLEVKDIIAHAESRGFQQLLIIGGGTINAEFLKNNLIDEVFISVHPKILGNGIKLFNQGEFDINLNRIGVKVLDEGLVQLHYKVLK